jgi:WD40 repeat protein
VWSCSFSHSGSLIATGSISLKLWDAGTGAPVREITTGSKVLSCCFSPDDAAILADGSLRLHSVATGALLQRIDQTREGTSWSCSFSRDGQMIASAGRDGLVKLWARGGAAAGG